MSPSFTPHYNYNSTLLTAVLLNCTQTTITVRPHQYISSLLQKLYLLKGGGRGNSGLVQYVDESRAVGSIAG